MSEAVAAGWWMALAYSLLPASGVLAGTFLAERTRLSKQRMALALHGATGVVVAVVAVELMPRALQTGPPWLMILLFLGGGFLFIAIDRATQVVATLYGDGEGSSAPWVLALGVGFDLFTDGIMIGAGSTVSGALGLLLGLGLLIADVPEGFTASAVLKRGGIARRVRIPLMLGLAASVPVGATIGLLLRNMPDVVSVGVLAVTAGTLMTLVVEEMAPQSHKGKEAEAASLVFLTGFAAFALLTVVIEA